MVTAPPAVTIPEDQRWIGVYARSQWTEVPARVGASRERVQWDLRGEHVTARLVTADEWDAICSRLAKLDRIEATRRGVKAGPAIPSPSDWEAFIDALDGEP